MAARTLARIASLTPLALRSTFDTAVVDTWACLATSVIVTLRCRSRVTMCRLSLDQTPLDCTSPAPPPPGMGNVTHPASPNLQHARDDKDVDRGPFPIRVLTTRHVTLTLTPIGGRLKRFNEPGGAL